MPAPRTWAPNPPEIELHAEGLPGQLAIFEPDDPPTTYLPGPLDHGLLRRCGGCNQMLPVGIFSRCHAGRDGLSNSCPDCSLRNTRVARGVAPAVARMRPSTDDRCAICKDPGEGRGLFLDHDHATGAFRGWLCTRCNAGIGFLRDHPELLAAARVYLEQARP